MDVFFKPPAVKITWVGRCVLSSSLVIAAMMVVPVVNQHNKYRLVLQSRISHSLIVTTPIISNIRGVIHIVLNLLPHTYAARAGKRYIQIHN